MIQDFAQYRSIYISHILKKTSSSEYLLGTTSENEAILIILGSFPSKKEVGDKILVCPNNLW